MSFSRFSAAPVLGLALLFLSGCASWEVNQIASQLTATGAAHALQQLEKVNPPERDRAQYLLNRGTLQFYLGDLPASRNDLDEAQRIMAALQATSLTENLAALSTNETLRAYTGTPTDQVLVHTLLALVWMGQGDLDGARVEILQSQVAMQRLAKADSSSGQLASARFLGGVIYELNREWDSALISYRQAYEILQQLQQPVPGALQDSLLQMTQRVGLKDEHDKFKKEFGRDSALPAVDENTLFLVNFDGVISSKSESRISIVAGAQPQMISVVVPTYRQSAYYPRQLTVAVNGQSASTQIIEDLEARARQDLDEEMTRIMATTTARAVAKYNMVNEVQNQSGMVGLVANLATLATEQADVRSWNMLPATIQVARIRVPSGSQVTVPAWADTESVVQQAVASGRNAVVVLGNLFSRLVSYPPVQTTSETEDSP